MPEAVTPEAFADAFVPDDDEIAAATEQSLELGVEPVSPATGMALALAAAARPAGSFVEIGTGAGVSGLWLLRGAPGAQLTTIDHDHDRHVAARARFQSAGHTGRTVRFITGRAADVLPRMNEDAYDLVLVDADSEPVAQYTETALRLVRPGGTVLVARVLQQGKVANPSRRDRRTTVYRDLLRGVREREDLLAGVSPVGDGLLQLVRR
ncbi:O-methyltransferase [Amnibacterium endophyticum]|uniref:O-methyltransferase n=1 Tax=Amnibacterium endophyticum TaxID=2109337 RepID=A0ABW4LAC7_9MICO